MGEASLSQGVAMVSHHQFVTTECRANIMYSRLRAVSPKQNSAGGCAVSIDRRLLFLLVFVIPVFAQSDRGSITGAVSDATGAIVAGVPVEVRNLDTGAVYNCET